MTKQMEETLLDFYRDRVDSVVKTLHWPTVALQLSDGKKSEESVQALRASLLFMGLCSAQPEECILLFSNTKATLLPLLQRNGEASLVEAKLLQTPDITRLQALVTYLQAIRACNAYASNWTLLAVAVRLASALRLQSGESTSISKYDIEIRRRLWFSICLMDTQAMLDRGSTPMIGLEELGSPPLDVDDNAIKAETVPDGPANGFTDMSFPLMMYATMKCQKQLSAIASYTVETGWRGWDQKLSILKAYEEYCDDVVAKANSRPKRPIQYFTSAAVNNIRASMRLILRRPPFRQSNSAAPPWDEFDVLESGTDVLESHLHLQIDQHSPWAWKRWIPWYALAVVLAELTIRPFGQPWTRGFKSAAEVFRRHAPSPADTESGPLWRPIAKLLRHVEHLQSSREISQVVSAEGDAHRLQLHDCNQRSSDIVNGNGLSGLSADPAVSLQLWDIPPGEQTAAAVMNEVAFHTLEPERGVSWIDWDLIMDQQEWDISIDSYWDAMLELPA